MQGTHLIEPLDIQFNISYLDQQWNALATRFRLDRANGERDRVFCRTAHRLFQYEAQVLVQQRLKKGITTHTHIYHQPQIKFPITQQVVYAVYFSQRDETAVSWTELRTLARNIQQRWLTALQTYVPIRDHGTIRRVK